MSDYIDAPIETDPQTLADDAYTYLQSQIPGWQPSDGNLETLLVEAMTSIQAELRDTASAVPTSIFRYFGGLLGVDPIDEAPSQVLTTWTAIDNKGYTIEAGTLIGFRVGGDEIVQFEVQNEVTIPAGSTTTGVGAVLAVAVESGAANNGLGGVGEAMELISPPLDWVSTIIMAEATGHGTDEEDDETYLSRLTIKLRLLTIRPVLPADFILAARDAALGAERIMATDLYRPDHNLLTINQSNVETNTTGFEVESNCTIARSTIVAAEGVASLMLTASAAGDMGARTLQGVSGVVVSPNADYTVLASCRADVGARNVQIGIRWYDSGGGVITTSLASQVSVPNTGFLQVTHTARSPFNAAYMAIVVIQKSAVGAGERLWVDKWAVRKGYNTVWSVGTTPATGNEKAVSLWVQDSAGEALSGSLMAQLQAYLQTIREVNFLIFVEKPMYTTIDVTFVARAKPGANTTDVDAAAEQAVRDYLSPANWGNITGADREWLETTTVRWGELYAAINGAEGVDYVSTLQLAIQGQTLGTSDVVIQGPAALTRAGTINGTVST